MNVKARDILAGLIRFAPALALVLFVALVALVPVVHIQSGKMHAESVERLAEMVKPITESERIIAEFVASEEMSADEKMYVFDVLTDIRRDLEKIEDEFAGQRIEIDSRGYIMSIERFQRDLIGNPAAITPDRWKRIVKHYQNSIYRQNWRNWE